MDYVEIRENTGKTVEIGKNRQKFILIFSFVLTRKQNINPRAVKIADSHTWFILTFYLSRRPQQVRLAYFYSITKLFTLRGSSRPTTGKTQLLFVVYGSVLSCVASNQLLLISRDRQLRLIQAHCQQQWVVVAVICCI